MKTQKCSKCGQKMEVVYTYNYSDGTTCHDCKKKARTKY